MFLGLDLGTTNVKTLLVDLDGSIAAQSSAPVTRSTTPDGGIEQDIEQIWQAALEAIHQAVAQVGSKDGKRIRAIGVSSQGGAVQLIDARDRPVGPVISWLDARGKPFDRQLEQELGKAYLIAHTGCNLSTTTLGQVLRLGQESPEMLKTSRGVGYVGDLIVGRLSGRRAHDPSSLSIAMLYNPTLGRADPDLLERLKLHDKRLPDIVPATQPAGKLLDTVARSTGLPEGIPVSPAVHDQYAASIGAGTAAEGDVLVGTGTAWVLLAVTGRLAPPIAPRTFVCPHPFEGLFGQLLSMGNGGSSVQWVLETTGRAGLEGSALDDRIANVAPGADGLRFWPLLKPDGPTIETASTDLAASTGGRIAGVTLFHSPDHLLRGVIEGLACELARHLEQFTAAGLPVNRLVVTGPVATGRVVPQILADTADRPVTCVRQSELSAFGAAVIARTLVEPGADLRETAAALVPDCHAIQPGTDASMYRDLFQAYREPFGNLTEE